MSFILDKSSLKSLTNFIESTYHVSAKINVPVIENHLDKLYDDYHKLFPIFAEIKELFKQFKNELMPHLKREEEEFFPVLHEIEECFNWDRDYNNCDLVRFEVIIKKVEAEHRDFDSYVYSLVDVFKNSNFKEENEVIYWYIENYLSTLEYEIMKHTEIENEVLHKLALIKYKKICHYE